MKFAKTTKIKDGRIDSYAIEANDIPSRKQVTDAIVASGQLSQFATDHINNLQRDHEALKEAFEELLRNYIGFVSEKGYNTEDHVKEYWRKRAGLTKEGK